MSKRIIWFLNHAQPNAFALIRKDNRHGHLRERSTRKRYGPAMIEHAIRLVEAERLGVHPKLLFGRFDAGNGLVYVLSSDGKTWTRERCESAEHFAERITRDLADRAGLPHAALAASA
jgi:hypothetical protein